MTTRPTAQQKEITPTTRSGMGTILYQGGAAFRVWAPFAKEVFIAGDFNEWQPEDNPLASEDNGYWSTDVKGARVGNEYKFVIKDDTDKKLWRRNPYASEVVNSSSNCIIHNPDFDWGDERFTMPPWNELVIYEMHVGTFHPPNPDAPGTFDEIIPQLPYLRELGINCIEIMPIAEYPLDFSWGYNPSQPFSVENQLGGPQGLFRFVKSAHQHGIAVVLDVVYNHCGPGDNDLWRFDGWHTRNHDGGIYFYDNERAHTRWGDTRPDYGRKAVKHFFRDNALFWLNKYRLDGLRFDSVITVRNYQEKNNNPPTDLADGWKLLQWINNDINKSQPWKITIAEDLQNNSWITKSTGEGGAGFGSQWDAGFVHPVRHALISQSDKERNMYALHQALTHAYNRNATQRIIYTESHDEVANGKSRLPEEIWPNNATSWYSRKRSTLGAVMVFTAPGIPMIFQGQEFLEDGHFSDRKPLDWEKLQTFKGIHLLYRDLIRLRRNWYNQTKGLKGHDINVHHVNNSDKVIGYHRWDKGGAGDDVIVILNFANRSYSSYNIGMPRQGNWRVRFNSDWKGYSDDFGNQAGYHTVSSPNRKDGMPYSANIGIGPYSALILSQDEG